MSTTKSLPPDYWQTYRVRGNEVDFHNRASASALADWMMVSAGVHAAQLGISMNRLHSGGAGWALARMVMECGEMPQAEQEVRLRTWPTSLERLQFRRDFQLFSLDGAQLARAATFWVIMDLNTRRLARMPQEYSHLIGDGNFCMEVDKGTLGRLHLPEAPGPGAFPNGNLAAGTAPEKQPGCLNSPASPEELAQASLAGEVPILVRRADLDSNRHVNSVRYVDWLMESIPQEIWESCRLRRLEVLYRSELRGGQAISRCSAVHLPEARPGEHAFIASVHALEDGQEREAIRAAMCWRPHDMPDMPSDMDV